MAGHHRPPRRRRSVRRPVQAVVVPWRPLGDQGAGEPPESWRDRAGPLSKTQPNTDFPILTVHQKPPGLSPSSGVCRQRSLCPVGPDGPPDAIMRLFPDAASKLCSISHSRPARDPNQPNPARNPTRLRRQRWNVSRHVQPNVPDPPPSVPDPPASGLFATICPQTSRMRLASGLFAAICPQTPPCWGPCSDRSVSGWIVDGARGSCGVCCNSSNDKIHDGPGQLVGVLVRLALRFPVPDIDGVEAAQ